MTESGIHMEMAIIFDLDGTLWDAAGCSCDIWNRVLGKHRELSVQVTPEMVQKWMGKTMEEIGEILLPEWDRATRTVILEELGEEEVRYLAQHGAVLYEGVEDVLKILCQKYSLYIVSNSQDGYVPAFLQAHKLGQYFRDVEMSGRTGLDKGNNIRLLMDRNQVTRAVYVGDTEGDERASHFAGIPFVYASYGFGTALSPDGVLADIRDLPAYMAGWQEQMADF